MDPLLEYACKRVMELEGLLLVAVVVTFSPGDIYRKICNVFESKQDIWQGGDQLKCRKMLIKLILNTANSHTSEISIGFDDGCI